jgi:type IV secretion system protein VirB11
MVKIDENQIDQIDRSLSVRQMLQTYGISDTLQQPITEFAINRPGEYWIENATGWHQYFDERLSLRNLTSLSTTIAVFNKKKLTRDEPIASLTLPDGERCQIVIDPACEAGTISITIRKPSSARFTLSNYVESQRLKPKSSGVLAELKPFERQLLKFKEIGDFKSFFELAIQHKLNVVTVGGTGSGKTTFSKALIDLYPSDCRLFTIEDAHELTTPLHPNSVHLFFSPTISAKSLLASAMRMKPDHIFITELRGDEAWDYLMALKSGHSGSVTSIHANDTLGALYKIGSYIKQSGVGKTLEFDYIMREVMTTIDIVAFFEHTFMTEIYYDPQKKLDLLTGAK